jgi:hypothetical protein
MPLVDDLRTECATKRADVIDIFIRRGIIATNYQDF